MVEERTDADRQPLGFYVFWGKGGGEEWGLGSGTGGENGLGKTCIFEK